jgi:murein DD-endopeptidase MepM/ murein hydrolase activator NlpD
LELIRRLLISLFFCVLLASCDNGNNFAPVTEISTIGPIPKTGVHQVMTDETGYEIAWRHGLDYRYVANKAGPLSTWRWPAKGKIVTHFSASNKGINIAGQAGEPIYAAAAGKVVYSGNGLRGYGNLIILKHNNLYLSAYAHNSNVLVKEGDWVRRGQKIAEMGDTGSDKVMLHFEIRRAGKSVNPTSLYH